MTLTRREFVAGAAAAACGGLCGCAAVNPAPLFDSADGTLALPEALSAPGSQIKVRWAGATILVWRTEKGFGAASIACTHLGSEVHLNAEAGTLDCPSHGSRFAFDGSVLHGPAKRPLTPYRVALERGRLMIEA